MFLTQYFSLLKFRILAISQYPLDIFLGVCGTVLWHLPNFILINIVFSNMGQTEIPKGYFILLYGLSVFGDGVQHTFAEALWQFGNTFIKSAKFDAILIKPMSNFIQVLTSRFDIDGIGGIAWGGFCCIYGYNMLNKISINGIIKIILCMFCSACFFVGINVLTAATAFFVYDNFYVTHTVFQFHMFARFPKNIYPKWMGGFLTLLIPVFAATYYPAQAFFNAGLFSCTVALFGSICFFKFSVFLWNILSKFYKSSGS